MKYSLIGLLLLLPLMSGLGGPREQFEIEVDSYYILGGPVKFRLKMTIPDGHLSAYRKACAKGVIQPEPLDQQREATNATELYPPFSLNGIGFPVGQTGFNLIDEDGKLLFALNRVVGSLYDACLYAQDKATYVFEEDIEEPDFHFKAPGVYTLDGYSRATKIVIKKFKPVQSLKAKHDFTFPFGYTEPDPPLALPFSLLSGFVQVSKKQRDWYIAIGDYRRPPGYKPPFEAFKAGKDERYLTGEYAEEFRFLRGHYKYDYIPVIADTKIKGFYQDFKWQYWLHLEANGQEAVLVWNCFNKESLLVLPWFKGKFLIQKYYIDRKRPFVLCGRPGQRQFSSFDNLSKLLREREIEAEVKKRVEAELKKRLEKKK